MSDIKELTEKIIKFQEERNWRNAQKPKDVALSVVLEAAELLEHFQWKSSKEVEEYVHTHKVEIGEEVADVAIYLFGLAHELGIDLKEAVEDKLQKNGKKYPVEKSKNNQKKF